MTKLYEGKKSGHTLFLSTYTALLSIYRHKKNFNMALLLPQHQQLAGMLLINLSNRSCGIDSQAASKQACKTSVSPLSARFRAQRFSC